ncbi:hypothetical protein GP486_005781 [Trichoglossum hirsutum]|uniref:Protein kinase domain-containing protein n=1 Tax=Trichoglossum hirsutum TaxID=265104 RepID=A0A9P8RLL7_9PEZI|nr:hypothetical protein GP486_005781 [Trichoglossum hirsutum]
METAVELVEQPSLRQAGDAASAVMYRGLEERMAEFFPASNGDTTISRTQFLETEIQQISRFLQQTNSKWSRVPRTYIVLRLIGQLHLLDAFIAQGITDFWFPFSATSLPDSISSSAKADFVRVQSVVLTKAVDLEKGEGGSHQHFAEGEPLPFESKAILGSGGFGQVDKIVSLISYNEYARKRIRRGKVFKRAKENMKSFKAGLEVLKRLKHRHVVELVGSYTDSAYLGLIMSPVADGNLAYFLAQIADFGVSLDWSDISQPTTQGATILTPRYCAPEVADYEPRNASSDIWSLGCVFVEMVTVLKGESLDDMKGFLENQGSQSLFYRNNLIAAEEWMSKLENIKGTELDNAPIAWIREVLQIDRTMRPTAAAIIERINKQDSVANYKTPFCGVYCMKDADDDSDDDCDGVWDNRGYIEDSSVSLSKASSNHSAKMPSSASQAIASTSQIPSETQVSPSNQKAPTERTWKAFGQQALAKMQISKESPLRPRAFPLLSGAYLHPSFLAILSLPSPSSSSQAPLWPGFPIHPFQSLSSTETTPAQPCWLPRRRGIPLGSELG